MLMQIISFLLEVAYSLLAGSCVLRLAMQRLRVSFANPAGRFVMALSNWIVLPLRKALPSLAGWDTASLVAALLLALLHQALLWGAAVLLAGAGAPAAVPLLVLAVFDLLRLLLDGLFGLLLLSAVLSWVQGGSAMNVMGHLAEQLCAPLLRPLRRLLPLVGGIDLAPLAAMVLVQIAQMLLGGLQATVLRAVG